MLTAYLRAAPPMGRGERSPRFFHIGTKTDRRGWWHFAFLTILIEHSRFLSGILKGHNSGITDGGFDLTLARRDMHKPHRAIGADVVDDPAGGQWW